MVLNSMPKWSWITRRSPLPESVSAVVAGLGVAGTAVAVQIGAWLKRAARRLGLLN